MFFLVRCGYLKFSTSLWSWKIPKESPICVIKLGRCLPPQKNLKIDEINQKMVNTQFFTKPIYNIGEHPHYFFGGGWLKVSITNHAILTASTASPASVGGEGSSERSVVLEGTDGSPHLLPAEHLAELGWFLGPTKN